MTITLDNVKKSYPMGRHVVQALRGVSLEVGAGDFCIVVGPSGSGKSTLLNLVGCLDTTDDGAVKIEGVDVKTLDDAGRAFLRNEKIGFIFQNFNLIPVLSVLENVEFPLLIGRKQLSRAEVRERAMRLIDKVGLTKYAMHRPDELSGGQMQRVAIARALVTNPSIVLADEPTANLDSVTANMVLDIMQEMNREQQVTFFLATHDQRVLKHAKRIIQIEDGLLKDADAPKMLH